MPEIFKPLHFVGWCFLICKYNKPVQRRYLQSKNDADDFDKDESSNEPNEDNGQSNKNTKAYKGMIDCLHQQFTQGGIRGLFQGMKAKLLSTVLTAAFTFLSYEQTLIFVGKVHQALLNDV